MRHATFGLALRALADAAVDPAAEPDAGARLERLLDHVAAAPTARWVAGSGGGGGASAPQSDD